MDDSPQRGARAETRDLVADDRDTEADTRDVEADAREEELDRREADLEALAAVWDADGSQVGRLFGQSSALREQARHLRGQAALRREVAARRREEFTERRRRAVARRERAAERLTRDEWSVQYPLAARFSALARHLFAATDLTEVVRHIVRAGVELLPGTDAASVMILNAEGRFRTPAQSGALALRLDEAQLNAGEGPCLDATRTGGLGIARCDDLAAGSPWPVFGAAAVRAGVRSVLSVGLFPDGDPPRLGALTFYARRPLVLADADLDLATVLAAHLATALVALHRVEESREDVVNLRQALLSRDVIGQAKGILMAQRRISAEEAFEALSSASQRLNAKLRDIADRVVSLATRGGGPPRQD
jgi:hypothetical protein